MFQRVVHIAPDLRHSVEEERFKAIGRNDAGRDIFVSFTLRRRGKETLVRPVSARYMHRKEADHYEKEIADFEE